MASYFRNWDSTNLQTFAKIYCTILNHKIICVLKLYAALISYGVYFRANIGWHNDLWPDTSKLLRDLLKVLRSAWSTKTHYIIMIWITLFAMGKRTNSNSEVSVCYRADHIHMLWEWKPNSCREAIPCCSLWLISFGSDYRSTQQTNFYLQVYQRFPGSTFR